MADAGAFSEAVTLLTSTVQPVLASVVKLTVVALIGAMTNSSDFVPGVNMVGAPSVRKLVIEVVFNFPPAIENSRLIFPLPMLAISEVFSTDTDVSICALSIKIDCSIIQTEHHLDKKGDCLIIDTCKFKVIVELSVNMKNSDHKFIKFFIIKTHNNTIIVDIYKNKSGHTGSCTPKTLQNIRLVFRSGRFLSRKKIFIIGLYLF